MRGRCSPGLSILACRALWATYPCVNVMSMFVCVFACLPLCTCFHACVCASGCMLVHVRVLYVSVILHMWPTDSIRSYVAKYKHVFFTLDKSRDSELENCILYTTVEEQWESNSALKIDKLVTSLLRKFPLNVLVNLET